MTGTQLDVVVKLACGSTLSETQRQRIIQWWLPGKTSELGVCK